MSKLVVRITDAVATGHGCTASTTLGTPTQDSVYVESLMVARKNDPTVSHTILSGGDCVAHTDVIKYGSPTVFAENNRVGYLTTPTDAGSMSGSNASVFVGTHVSLLAKYFSDPSLGISVSDFPHTLDSSDHINKEHFAALLNQGRATEEATSGFIDDIEFGEYGDGNISGGVYNNVSPITGQSGQIATQHSQTGVSENDNQDQTNATECACLNFASNCDPNIKTSLRDILCAICTELGTTLNINSAYRSPAYNAKIGGAKNSQHVKGQAVDVNQVGWSTSDRQNLLSVSYAKGIRGIGVYNSFTHLDIGGKRAWGYGPPVSRTSLPLYPWAQSILGPLGYATS